MESDSQDEITSRVDRLERNQERIVREIDQLRRELVALGVELPELNPAGRTPLSPQARLKTLQRAAARARAGKTVGPGVGQLNDPETLERLQSEASELFDNPREDDDSE